MNEKITITDSDEDIREVPKPKINAQDMSVLRSMLALNQAALLDRSAFFKLLDLKADINNECGYPDDITPQEYQEMYDREGVATRVVQVLPEESWRLAPEIYETEGKDETGFEIRWKELETKFHIFSYLKRADILSGIGRFGILIIGIDDGKPLDQPVDGIDPTTGISNNTTQTRELLYLKALPESAVTVADVEFSVNSPRYGLPTKYNVQFVEYAPGGQNSNISSKSVHWTRVVHLTDNRDSSEVYGVPRMKPVYNRLVDIRKTLGGSTQMFWKGGFPGTSYEQIPEFAEIGMTEPEKADMKQQIKDFRDGLQRDLFLKGITAKQFQMQVADPTGQMKNLLNAIAVTYGIPLRIFMGSEEAKLASSQDTANWNGRVGTRREVYLSPYVVRGFVDRLMDMGVMAKVEEYFVFWPDLNTYTEKEKADAALVKTQAMAQYVSSGAEALIVPKHFLTMVLDFTDAEATAIEDEATNNIRNELSQQQIDQEAQQKFLDQQKVAQRKQTIKENPQQQLGGEGSGNFDHEGRPGEVGGSGEGDGNKAGINIVKSTEKAHLLEKDGQKFWIQKRWLKEDGSLTPAGIKSFEEAKAATEERAKGTKYYEVASKITKETEKAVMIDVPVEIPNIEKTVSRGLWIPKSMLREGHAPEWFLQKKMDEISEEIYDRFHTGALIFPEDVMDITKTKYIKNDDSRLVFMKESDGFLHKND